MAAARTMIKGIAASPGTARGIARVVQAGMGDEPIGPRDVLIVSKATPTMTPLLLSAGAVVTDLGNYISHAAVVARELGIPCVVSCGDATSRIPPGRAVVVDGDRGIVEVLEV